MSETHLTPDELEAQVEVQREHLADTVDQLAYKLDVKAQAKARLDSLRDRIRPEVVVGFVSAAVLAAGLVWWRRR
jgi:hypothetical protein